MRFGSLAIAAVAATGGGLLGYFVSGDGTRVTATTSERTVTVMETVKQTVVRTNVRPNRRAGKRVFAAACSRCHTLKPGDWTRGRVNLTDLRPSYRATVEKVTGGGIAMPSFRGRLSKRQIRDVAAFVTAQATRRGGKTR
jgi:mono/diheme cytochrome c family protein